VTDLLRTGDGGLGVVVAEMDRTMVCEATVSVPPKGAARRLSFTRGGAPACGVCMNCRHALAIELLLSADGHVVAGYLEEAANLIADYGLARGRFGDPPDPVCADRAIACAVAGHDPAVRLACEWAMWWEINRTRLAHPEDLTHWSDRHGKTFVVLTMRQVARHLRLLTGRTAGTPGVETVRPTSDRL
jgi:hypothetical protein